MEKEYEIEESLYQMIKGAKTREEILKTFKKEERLRKFKDNNDEVNPLYAFTGCFDNAFHTRKDPKAAEKFFDFFKDDLGPSERETIIITLVRSFMELLKQPDIFAGVGHWMYKEIYYRSKDESPLLIIGERGTGKGKLARLIHEIGRGSKEFEETNCAAFPEALIESELFGHEKGAFTGAMEKKDGILKTANEGTVFLDEIGKMPDHLQAKLLKAVDERKIRPVGSEKTIDIDVRFIAAAQPQDAKTIIPDLKDRLGCPDFIKMPTVEQLLQYGRQHQRKIIDDSLSQAKKTLQFDKNIKISEFAFDVLVGYKYKGNFREMQNILKKAIRSMDMAGRTEIMPDDFSYVLNKNKELYEGEEKSPSADELNLKTVKLKNIIDHADKQKISIIETKINEALSSGKNFKTVLMSEGLSEKEYLNFRKKVVTITGKKIKEFGL